MKSNFYTLGSFPEPLLLPVVDLAIEIINLWFWLLAYTWFYNKEYVDKFDDELKTDYLEKKRKVLSVKSWLIEQRQHLIEELKNE